MDPSLHNDETSWLAALALEKLKPLSIEIDDTDCIIAISGNPGDYGFSTPNIGCPVTDCFEFTFGVDFSAEFELDFVETPNGRAAHASLYSSSKNRSLVMVDATLERDQRQAMQQKSHELALLSDEQTSLLSKLNKLNIELAKKKQEADDLNKLQSQFLASMSHEFRTPLASILTYTEYLSSPNPKISIRDGLSAVDRSAKHLLNLVENLIGHAQFKLEDIRLDVGPVKFEELHQDFQALFAPIASSKGLSLQINCQQTVPNVLLLDAMRFRQMVINLLGNACKYTEVGEVGVVFSWHDGYLITEVNDSGVGISKESQDRIFAAFERGDASDAQGAGLGLHITQRLVELMGGEITLDSEPGNGTTITMKLPAAAAENDTSADGVTVDRNVLVVEDDSDVYDILEIYLDDAGYKVFHADSGQTALEMFEHIAPHAVITDINVPEIDGITLTERMRETGFTGPIVILTGSGLKRDRERAELAGCSVYMVKPVSPASLLQQIAKS